MIRIIGSDRPTVSHTLRLNTNTDEAASENLKCTARHAAADSASESRLQSHTTRLRIAGIRSDEPGSQSRVTVPPRPDPGPGQSQDCDRPGKVRPAGPAEPGRGVRRSGIPSPTVSDSLSDSGAGAPGRRSPTPGGRQRPVTNLASKPYSDTDSSDWGRAVARPRRPAAAAGRTRQ
eukprot:381977-Hanusia_phi.AAC.1